MQGQLQTTYADPQTRVVRNSIIIHASTLLVIGSWANTQKEGPQLKCCHCGRKARRLARVRSGKTALGIRMVALEDPRPPGSPTRSLGPGGAEQVPFRRRTVHPVQGEAPGEEQRGAHDPQHHPGARQPVRWRGHSHRPWGPPGRRDVGKGRVEGRGRRRTSRLSGREGRGWDRAKQLPGDATCSTGHSLEVASLELSNSG